jgi:hypothetical protein
MPWVLREVQRYPRGDGARFGNAFLQNLAVLIFLVIHQLISIKRVCYSPVDDQIPKRNMPSILSATHPQRSGTTPMAYPLPDIFKKRGKAMVVRIRLLPLALSKVSNADNGGTCKASPYAARQ